MRYIRSTQFLLSSVVFAHFELLTIRNGNIDHGELDYFVGWIALLELDKYTPYPRSTVVQCLLLTATPNYSRTQRSCHRRHRWSKCVNEKRTCLFISRLARGSTLFVRVFRTFFWLKLESATYRLSFVGWFNRKSERFSFNDFTRIFSLAVLLVWVCIVYVLRPHKRFFICMRNNLFGKR